MDHIKEHAPFVALGAVPGAAATALALHARSPATHAYEKEASILKQTYEKATHGDVTDVFEKVDSISGEIDRLINVGPSK